MKRKGLLLFPSIFAMSLTACASGVKHNISEYILQMEYKSDFRILQLTDVHLGDKDNLETHFKFMDLTINEANPNLIVVTGDLFTFASKTTAMKLFEFLDSHNANWTVTFGNHDEQCYFSIEWVTGYLNDLTEDTKSYCIFKDIQDDDITGNSNFVINLKDGDEIIEQLIFIDSNRYHFGSYIGYDYIKENQVEWYKRVVDATTTLNGHLTESLLFYHIPIPEFNDAYDAAKSGTEGAILEEGEKRENVCCPEYNSGLFDAILEKGSTKGMFVGHDHVNNYRVLYKGVYFSYGVNSTDRIYFDEDLIGGQVITVNRDHSLGFNQLIKTYEDYE